MFKIGKAKRETAPPHEWTTGHMKYITHEALIACGGFGEVHKVAFLHLLPSPFNIRP
jgi:hypothetical protein